LKPNEFQKVSLIWWTFVIILNQILKFSKFGYSFADSKKLSRRFFHSKIQFFNFNPTTEIKMGQFLSFSLKNSSKKTSLANFLLNYHPDFFKALFQISGLQRLLIESIFEIFSRIFLSFTDNIFS
jgi:hypothetical protein